MCNGVFMKLLRLIFHIRCDHPANKVTCPYLTAKGLCSTVPKYLYTVFPQLLKSALTYLSTTVIMKRSH